MVSREEVFSILKKELAYLEQAFGVERVAVFGSFANGTITESSDIDLLIEFKDLPGLKFIKLVDYLEDKLGKKVDILTPAGLEGIRIPRVAQEIKQNMRYV